MEQKKDINTELLIFIIPFLLFGVLFVYLGIKEQFKNFENYLTTEGRYINSNCQPNQNFHCYIYEVKGKSYIISTDYESSFTPKLNSIKNIKYNPNNPSEAIVVTIINSSTIFMFLGIIFIIFSLFLMSKGKYKKINKFLAIMIFILLITPVLLFFYENNIALNFNLVTLIVFLVATILLIILIPKISKSTKSLNKFIIFLEFINKYQWIIIITKSIFKLMILLILTYLFRKSVISIITLLICIIPIKEIIKCIISLYKR